MNKVKVYLLLFFCCLSTIGVLWRIKYSLAELYNEKACKTSSISVGLERINKALSIDNNPLFWANKGILYSRYDTIFIDSFLNDEIIDDVKLDSTVHCFKSAFELSDKEWSFKLNYSLSLWLLGRDKKNSMDLLHEAINSHDVGCELLGILGMMEEKCNNFDVAQSLYFKMIKVRPSIVDSRFFNDLKSRNRKMSEELIDSTIRFYSDVIMDNPVAMTRQGILFYEKGLYRDSETLLTGAISLMPTLNRAWYYLGLLAEINNQRQKSREFYYKSMILDRYDILPLKKMVMFDSKYRSDFDYLNRHKKNDLAIGLTDRFFATSMGDPFVICELSNYFVPDY